MSPASCPTPWFVCQIGAREHYAIPRALHARGLLGGLITDFWVEPGSVFGRLPGGRRLKDRFHDELADCRVFSPVGRMLAFELRQRLSKRQGWEMIQERNRLFQRLACAKLSSLSTGSRPLFPDPSHLAPTGKNGTARRSVPTLFSYSYAAGDLFRFAKGQGWTTVLGQIDPGPEEERIVAEEHRRYPHLESSWQPAPPSYWDSWREELDLADRILVNSEWSRECLLKEGVPVEKMEVVPLVYREVPSDRSSVISERSKECAGVPLRVLFLGQINLRKGIGRLLDAMRLLKDEPIELTLAGPSEIDPAAWVGLPKVRWIGPVPRSEVEIHYDAADVFILPTLSDGYALTQLEALSRGLPVIASRHCGAAVQNGKNGWILSDLQAETIAESLREVVHRAALSMAHRPTFGLDQLLASLIKTDSAESGLPRLQRIGSEGES